MYADGGGLYLQVRIGSASATKSWIFRYKIDKRERWMGLGSYPTITLEEARRRAEAQRKLKIDRLDPISERDADRIKRALEAAKSISFKEAALAFIQDNKGRWKNAKHGDQWDSTLATYVYPVIGDLPVASVDTGLICKALRPIWHAKPETASRLRGRIESVLAAAKAQGQRIGENPAQREAVQSVLGRQQPKKTRTVHRPALGYSEVSTFIADLQQMQSVAARALEFLILTAARTNEVIGARWDEFDFESGVWTVPKSRMKAKREHRVPLNERAAAVAKSMSNLRHSDSSDAYVFPGLKKSKPLTSMAMLSVLKRMSRKDITVHGFRSTFKDWCAECTNFENILSEAALAHIVNDATEAAYRRGELFSKRVKLMQAWGAFCVSSFSRAQKRSAS